MFSHSLFLFKTFLLSHYFRSFLLSFLLSSLSFFLSLSFDVYLFLIFSKFITSLEPIMLSVFLSLTFSRFALILFRLPLSFSFLLLTFHLGSFEQNLFSLFFVTFFNLSSFIYSLNYFCFDAIFFHFHIFFL